MRDRLIVLAAVLLIRLPFLNQPVQGDDYYYLAGAEHAQIEPLHPLNARYVFIGHEVSMRGHPHPPLNVWALGGLLAVFGDIHEVPFHAAYIVFSLIAAFSMLSLARRYSPRPLLATLLFIVTPAFVVNGNSFESDVPFLAFWMAAAALFIAGRLFPACIAMALAAMAAYQAVVLVPILAVWLWLHKRNWRAGWIALLTIPLTLAAWQLFERITNGAFPAQLLGQNFQTYKFQSIQSKFFNAAGLTAHAGMLLFPGTFVWWLAAAAGGFVALIFDRDPFFCIAFGLGAGMLARAAKDDRFLACWALIFYAAALVLFFTGSARYLLPVAAPVALAASRSLTPRRLAIAAGLQLVLSLALAIVNYQHWDGYRQFARSLRKETETRRVWVNGEWSLRHYFESDGALPLIRGQSVQPGEMVVSGTLSQPHDFTTGGGVRTPVAASDINSSIPLRLVGLDVKSGWSVAGAGRLRPFDISLAPLDRLRAELIVQREPQLEYLPMNAPEAETQLVSGVFNLEASQWRWMTDRAVILLKRPSRPSVLQAVFHLDSRMPARSVTLSVDGVQVAAAAYPGEGQYTLASGELPPGEGTATVVITADKAISPPGDSRRLGIILKEVGFRSSDDR